MPFKIVKTIENGELNLWTVPESWECDGILRCPKFKFEELRRNHLSVPLETWQVIDCILVRSNLRSFQAAELVVKQNNGATDINETNGAANDDQAIKKNVLAGIPVVEGSKLRSLLHQDNRIPETTKSPNDIRTPSFHDSEMSSKVDALSTKVSDIAKKQTEMFVNQTLIINKLTEILKRIDEASTRSPAIYDLALTTGNPIFFKPIADTKSLVDLEESLKDENTFIEMKKRFAIICGVGKGRGINNSYALIDAMFDRKFLLECSWAGGSRSSTAKVCFKTYQNTINLFFQIIYSSDKLFTMMELEIFFKNILKNARKRSDSKKLRASRSKNRSKQNRLNCTTDNEQFAEPEIENVLEFPNSQPDHDVLKEEIVSGTDEEDSGYFISPSHPRWYNSSYCCSGLRIVYFTVLFPYVVLIALFVRGVTLPGAWKGILYYIFPDWGQLAKPKVWADAATQIFYSLGPGWGGLVGMASFNRFNYKNLRSSIIIPLVNSGTSIWAGFVVFSVLGFAAERANVSVGEVATAGPGLAFVTYPAAVSMMPAPNVWAITFFVMLFFLGIDTMFVTIEAVITGLFDEFPKLQERKRLITFLTCVALFLLSIICNTEGGLHVIGLLDAHVAIACVPLVCALEITAAVYTYGPARLSRDILFMTGQPLAKIWLILWRYILPVILLVITVYSLKEATSLGWFVALASVVCIPIHAVRAIYQSKGSFLQRIKESSQPNEQWGPSEPHVRQRWLSDMQKKGTQVYDLDRY